MYTSEKRARVPRVALLAWTALAAAGCGDPLATRQPGVAEGLSVFMVVDPDQASQPLVVKTAAPGGSVRGLRVELETADGTDVPFTINEPIEGFELLPCVARYGSIVGDSEPSCVDLSFAVTKGETYRISVSAEEEPTATASFTVPRDFALTRVQAEGSPPGTGGLQVEWTPSAGAYRYLVAVRPQGAPQCVKDGGCQRTWFEATTGTSVRTTVPAGELDGSEGPWFVDVYAVDRPMYEYLTSGVAEDLFPVPPIQNVERGYGAVGSWVRRSQVLR